MRWTTHLLVIANRTLASDELARALRERAAESPIRVTLVVPADGPRGPVAERVRAAVERLTREGLHVEAVVGDADPIVAVGEIWDPRRFDEVVVVTLPTDLSRWLTLDLPHRVERLTGARVTHVVAGASRRVPRAYA